MNANPSGTSAPPAPRSSAVPYLVRTTVAGGYKASTVRFLDGKPCCTSTYNYRMPGEQKTLLCLRIAAALNATRYLSVEQIEAFAAKSEQVAAQHPTEKPHVPIAEVAGGYKASTVRFVGGEPCYTSTYNYRMPDEEKALLARRIAAALNATRFLAIPDIENLGAKRAQSRGATP